VQDVIFGLFAIVAGLIFCFRGFLALRIIFPIWGAFTGFALGAGLIASWTDDRFLSTVLGWVVGIVVGIVFAILAYFFYALAVIIGMGAVGFAIGSGLIVAFGIDWNWVAVLVGVLAGVVLAVAAVVADLPLIVLIVASALGGAGVITSGFMLLFGSIDTEDFTNSGIVDRIDDRWWWWVVFIVLAIAGVVAQSRMAEDIKMGMREAWGADAVV